MRRAGDVGRLHHAHLGPFTQKPIPERLSHLRRAHPLQRVHPDQPLYHMPRLLRYIFVYVVKIALTYFIE